MDDGQIWLILFGISLVFNGVLLLWRPILSLLRRKDQVSEDNIMAMVEEGEESGAIQTNEKEFIENVLEFDNSTAKDVMVHRTDMVTLPADAEEGDILDAIRQSGLSRFPVYGEDADDILGVLSTRDYLLNFHQEQPLPLKELLRPAYFVPETVAADVLFRDMQGKKTHMALVVDEYGGTSGLVTLEDLLEELVGNIYDEFDPQEEQEIIQRGRGGRWRGVRLRRFGGTGQGHGLRAPRGRGDGLRYPGRPGLLSAVGHPGGRQPSGGGGPGAPHPGGGAVRPPGGVGPGGEAEPGAGAGEGIST